MTQENPVEPLDAAKVRKLGGRQLVTSDYPGLLQQLHPDETLFILVQLGDEHLPLCIPSEEKHTMYKDSARGFFACSLEVWRSILDP